MNLTRFQQMSTTEIHHRMREQIRRKADKLRFRARRSLDEDSEFDFLIERNGASLKSYFAHGPAHRFYPSTKHREEISDFVVTRRPEWIDRAIQQAGFLCDHRVNLLGYTDVALGGDIDWH